MELITASSEAMTQILSSLLNEGEALRTPVCAVLEKIGRKRYNRCCYVGTTDTVILVAMLSAVDTGKAELNMRIPLNAKKIKVKQSLITRQTLVEIEFGESGSIKMRAAKKVLTGGFANQEENLDMFIKKLF